MIKVFMTLAEFLEFKEAAAGYTWDFKTISRDVIEVLAPAIILKRLGF